ncbi:hypothetical protein JOC78_000316 [Bacillus ectoiniformans]|nr:hypothetical protein [Bacillus ectoiniformans]
MMHDYEIHMNEKKRELEHYISQTKYQKDLPNTSWFDRVKMKINFSKVQPPKPAPCC